MKYIFSGKTKSKIRQDIGLIRPTVAWLNKLPFQNRSAIIEEAQRRFCMSDEMLEKCLQVSNSKKLRKKFIEEALQNLAAIVNLSMLHESDKRAAIGLFEMFRYWMIEWEPDHIEKFLSDSCNLNKRDSIWLRKICTKILKGHNIRTDPEQHHWPRREMFDIWFNSIMNK